MNIHKSDKHTILTLHLSKDFKLPSFIQNESIQVIESILLQAQELFELQYSMHFKHSDDTLKLFYDKKLIDATIDAQKAYSSDLQCWQNEKQQLSQEIARLQLIIQENLFQSSKSIDLKNQELSSKVLDATLQAQKSYASELNRWQQERSQFSQEITRLQIDLQEKVHQASKVLESKNQELTGKLLAATSQISQLQDDRLDLEKRTREFASQTFDSQLQSIKDAHLRESENLKTFIISYKSDLESYKIKYEDLLSQKTKTSTKLGQIGELSFEDLCLQSGIQVINTAKKGHQADLVAVIHNHKVLIEVKNYSYTVPKDEITKFYRDMYDNKDCVAGIFASMKTYIANTPPFHIDWLSDRRPVIFVSNMNNYDGLYLLEIIKNLIGIIQHYTVNESDSNLQDQIERSARGLEASVNKLSLTIKNIRQYRNQSTIMFDDLDSSLKSLKDDVAHSLSVLTGKLLVSHETVTTNETPTPKPVKKKRVSKSTTSSLIPVDEHAS
jgi:hypothetical protein